MNVCEKFGESTLLQALRQTPELFKTNMGVCIKPYVRTHVTWIHHHKIHIYRVC